MNNPPRNGPFRVLPVSELPPPPLSLLPITVLTPPLQAMLVKSRWRPWFGDLSPRWQLYFHIRAEHLQAIRCFTWPNWGNLARGIRVSILRNTPGNHRFSLRMHGLKDYQKMRRQNKGLYAINQRRKRFRMTEAEQRALRERKALTA